MYCQAFVLGAIRQLEELADDQPRFTAEALNVMRSRDKGK